MTAVNTDSRDKSLFPANDLLPPDRHPVFSDVVMPDHQNPYSGLFHPDRPPIFGGWVLQTMISGASSAINVEADAPFLISGIRNISFEAPVLSGDDVSVFQTGDIEHEVEATKNRVAVSAEMWVNRRGLPLKPVPTPTKLKNIQRVSSGKLTYASVPIDILKKIAIGEKRMSVRGEFPCLNHAPTLRVSAKPADTGSHGFALAGWGLSKCDLAAAEHAALFRADENIVVTGIVPKMDFLGPLLPGNDISIYTEILKTGTSSVDVDLKVFAHHTHRYKPGSAASGRNGNGDMQLLATGVFKMISFDPESKTPTPLEEQYQSKTGEQLGELRFMPSLYARALAERTKV